MSSTGNAWFVHVCLHFLVKQGVIESVVILWRNIGHPMVFYFYDFIQSQRQILQICTIDELYEYSYTKLYHLYRSLFLTDRCIHLFCRCSSRIGMTRWEGSPTARKDRKYRTAGTGECFILCKMNKIERTRFFYQQRVILPSAFRCHSVSLLPGMRQWPMGGRGLKAESS